MSIRRWAEFTTDLPDDSIEDDTGFIQWPGKNIAEALAEILVGLGCTEVEVDDLEHRGYDVNFTLGERVMAARVTVIDNPLVGFGAGSHRESSDLMDRVSTALANDGRFHDIRWFADDEVLTGVEGSLSPLAEPPNKPLPFDKVSKAKVGAVRPWVRFTTDLPEDGVRAKDGAGFDEIPGRGVAEEVSKMLARSGCKTTRQLYRHDLGWDLWLVAGKRRLTARVRLADRWLVGVWQEGWMAKTFGVQHPEYVEVLRRLNEQLAKDPCFHDAQWFAEPETQAGVEGARSPVDD